MWPRMDKAGLQLLLHLNWAEDLGGEPSGLHTKRSTLGDHKQWKGTGETQLFLKQFNTLTNKSIHFCFFVILTCLNSKTILTELKLRVWIGLSDISKEIWQWVDGSSVSNVYVKQDSFWNGFLLSWGGLTAIVWVYFLQPETCKCILCFSFKICHYVSGLQTQVQSKKSLQFQQIEPVSCLCSCRYWTVGEPNNFEGNPEGCVEIRPLRDDNNIMNWNDEPCHFRRNWVCEI